jgi:superfamily II DNA/RNA helicase
MDILTLKNTYDINIYEIYKNLKKSEKIEYNNDDLWKIFEYFSCIKLMEEYNRPFYQYDDISPDFKEQNNLSKRDTGIDACDLLDTIVQCKLRKKTLNYTDCSTFFASQIIYDDVLNKPIIKWNNLIITRNTECILSENLVFKKKLFIDKTFSKQEIILYCDKLINEPPKYFEIENKNFELRDYQKESIDIIKNNNNVILCLPTGAGKNIIIIQSLEDNKRYLILVPRIILMEQLYDDIITHKPHLKNKIGLLGGSNIFDTQKDILICVYNSVKHIVDYASSFDKIFIDEAHHIVIPELYIINNEELEIETNIIENNNSEYDEYSIEKEIIEIDDIEDEIKKSTNYIKIIKEFKQFNNNIYLSATIDPIDGFIFYKKDIRDMIETGYICDYTINVPIFTDDPTNKNICEYLIQNYRHIIIYCNTAKEGKNINKILNELQKGSSEYIDCNTKKNIRMKNIEKFKKGNLQFLVNVRILVEGFNAPITKGVCFLHIPSSQTSMIQIIGRCLRLHPETNKRYANIILPYSTESDENHIENIIKTIARNDRKIRKQYQNKKINSYININNIYIDDYDGIDKFQEQLNLKFEMIYNSMGKLLNGKEIWLNNLKDVKVYMKTYNKKPSIYDKNKEIRSLGKWIIKQNGNMKERLNIMKNDDIYNEWNIFINDIEFKKYFLDNKTKWRNILNEVKKYIDKYKKLPMKSNNNEEIKKLGQWISDQIKNEKGNRKYIMKENDIYNEWIKFTNHKKYRKYFLCNKEKNKIEWKNKLNKLKIYIDIYNKLPLVTNKNNDIRRLNMWLQTQVTNTKNERKNIMKEDDIYNEWINFINDKKYSRFFNKKISWKDKLERVKLFIEKNNKIPSTHYKDENIKNLGKWLLKQFKNATKQRLQLMKDDDIYNEWIKFINSKEYSKYFNK